MLFSALRVPVRIVEHPIESVVASLLLLALLFVSSADHHAEMPAAQSSQIAPAKL